jgi:hypothetical protein
MNYYVGYWDGTESEGTLDDLKIKWFKTEEKMKDFVDSLIEDNAINGGDYTIMDYDYIEEE